MSWNKYLEEGSNRKPRHKNSQQNPQEDSLEFSDNKLNYHNKSDDSFSKFHLLSNPTPQKEEFDASLKALDDDHRKYMDIQEQLQNLRSKVEPLRPAQSSRNDGAPVTMKQLEETLEMIGQIGKKVNMLAKRVAWLQTQKRGVDASTQTNNTSASDLACLQQIMDYLDGQSPEQ